MMKQIFKLKFLKVLLILRNSHSVVRSTTINKNTIYEMIKKLAQHHRFVLNVQDGNI